MVVVLYDASCHGIEDVVNRSGHACLEWKGCDVVNGDLPCGDLYLIHVGEAYMSRAVRLLCRECTALAPVVVFTGSVPYEFGVRECGGYTVAWSGDGRLKERLPDLLAELPLGVDGILGILAGDQPDAPFQLLSALFPLWRLIDLGMEAHCVAEEAIRFAASSVPFEQHIRAYAAARLRMSGVDGAGDAEWDKIPEDGQSRRWVKKLDELLGSEGSLKCRLDGLLLTHKEQWRSAYETLRNDLLKEPARQ
jgi:hypothetical protein